MDDKQIFLSPDLAYRLAAIDIGTNSMRLMIAEPFAAASTAFWTKRKKRPGWAESSKTGRLDPVAVEESLAALRRMKQIAEGFQVTQTANDRHLRRAREAANGEEFCRRANDEFGSTLR